MLVKNILIEIISISTDIIWNYYYSFHFIIVLMLNHCVSHIIVLLDQDLVIDW